MMRKLTLFFSIALLTLVVGGPVRNQEATPKPVVIIAEVAAYNLSLLSLLNLTSVANTDVVLVRVGRSLSGKVKGRYLIVRYEYWTDESPLPEAFRRPKLKWKLELRRDARCDLTMAEALSKERAPGLVLLPGHELEKEKESAEPLPCYVLRPKGLTLHKD